MKGGVMWIKIRHCPWSSDCSWSAAWLAGCALALLFSCGKLSNTYAAEPIAQMPLSEFKGLIVRVDNLKQREKLQAELIGHLKEKDKVQSEYIEKIEAANETIQAYATKLEEHNAKLEELANDPRWTQRVQDWGTASGVTSVVLYLGRKLILKF